MATRTFEIRTEPHEAVIGDVTLQLAAEVVGAEFAQAYASIREVQAKVKAAQGGKSSSTKHAKADGVDAETLTELSEAMRAFVRRFMLPDSQTVFDGMRIPDRVLVKLMEYVAELYGGGSGNQDAAGGTSSA
uniref:Tail assembly chaperone n=1 Tax=Streptomyces phage Geonosis TaxID=3158856 RepID=A0AAU7GZ65_9CAUD